MTDSNRRSHVALIEDNPADVYLVREALRAFDLNCELTVFQTFETAIEAIKSGVLVDLDAFLIDLNLRTGSGLDILDVIRRSEEFRRTAVAIFTSSDSPRDRDAAIQLGANLYIRKPTELDSFLTEVGYAIRRLTGGTEQRAAAY
jgi:two-component system, chemotaxis family, response regulator Rcp1